MSNILAIGTGLASSDPQTLADIADGLVPRSLRSDTIHLNNRGYQLVANRVLQAIQDMGWT